MNSSIPSRKRKNTSYQPHKERQTLRRPSPLIKPLSEDDLRGAYIGERNERDQRTEEAQDMDDQNHALEFGQHRAADGINAESEGSQGPEVEGRVPAVGDVVGTGENGEALD